MGFQPMSIPPARGMYVQPMKHTTRMARGMVSVLPGIATR